MFRLKKSKSILLMIFGIILACFTLPFIIGVFSLFFIFPPLFLLFLNLFVFNEEK
ncbi:hypothetical protein H6Y62_00260 [Staphylococcus lugdunensis]|uniref:hypothetical protein n=1 Tax=Staphylococcus TaxID=1279 RepID=UPI0004B17335|nr:MULTISPECIES: hypothetical protein [Staphylococcus]MCC2083007.1 hypothetical protein [Staphylococcus lugdunensis]MCH8649057.1 hypothetical protein [Staphylococcus lugdunensis]MCH8652967.1 hypothetical protein [Staphylococcus lugdunensis]MCH8660287.1 hypothetical protein [Staphylococcus lugdunensis]MCH8679664.1 hypothetical protein [Staphylococcus lugdunensis]